MLGTALKTVGIVVDCGKSPGRIRMSTTTATGLTRTSVDAGQWKREGLALKSTARVTAKRWTLSIADVGGVHIGPLSIMGIVSTIPNVVVRQGNRHLSVLAMIQTTASGIAWSGLAWKAVILQVRNTSITHA